MSAAIHTPCHSPTSSQDFLGFRNSLQDMHDSPFQYPHSPFQRVAVTPPRMQPLLLSPSPVGRKINDSIDLDLSMQLDFDDFSAATGVSTPFRQSKKHALSSRPGPSETVKDLPSFFRPPGSPSEDDDEGLFLRSHSGHTSLPLRTPERVSYNAIRVPCSVANSNFPHVPKRKTKRLSSPKSRCDLTPLHIHHASEDGRSLKRFATLAPLPAPRFVREHKSVGCNVSRDVDILKEMRIADKVTDTDTDNDSDEGLSSLKVRRTMRRSRPSSGGPQMNGVSKSPNRHHDTRRMVSIPAPDEHLPPLATSRISHTRKGSNTSVNNAESLRRTSKTLEQSRPVCERRLASSATLFFGPAIVYPNEPGRAKKDHGSYPLSTPARTEEMTSTSPDSPFTSAFPKLAETSVQFSFTLTSEPTSPPANPAKLPTKFKKSHDSGVALSDGEAEETSLPVLGSSYTKPDSHCRSHGRASTCPQPSASNTISTETTLFDESFVTPSHDRSRDSNRPASPVDVSLVDEFIVKTLEAGTKDEPVERRPPGTPQKRTKTVFLGLAGQRPWASAAVEKMERSPRFENRLPAPNFSSIVDSGGSAGNFSVPKATATANNKGRRSCPGDLRFPMTTVVGLRSNGSTTDDAEMSPTDVHLANPRNRNYGNVGLGRPSTKFTASQFLSRSSSGFSTTSEGSEGGNAGTPTRCAVSRQKSNDFRVPLLSFKHLLTPSPKPRNLTPPSPVSPSITKVETRVARYRNEHLSNASKHMKENKRPDLVGGLPRMESKEKASFLKSMDALPLSSKKQDGARESTAGATQPLGRFERDFVEVDKIGSGEFGSAIKVRFKREDKEGHVYAVKKSKRFEGNRHRLRLREEVEVLQHLSACAGPEFHPNVLGYVDSWEQDDRLYILTELCEFGNFAHFLDEYGRHFRRLDEARVWKIFADISSGLRFIHMAHVVHFDLKPANVFITGAGRFKVGDFGMASFWPRSQRAGLPSPFNDLDFEREGDKMYLSAEVLQGRYGKEADVFSFGMMMLEATTNIFLPAQGDSWHRLREQDFSQVEGFTECSSSLRRLITSMMKKDPAMRPTADEIYSHDVISRARAHMEGLLVSLQDQGESQPDMLFRASPLAGADDLFLSSILGEDVQSDTTEMDCAD